MASKLTPGSWMLFSSSDKDQPFWLGRAMSKEEWSGACFWKNETTRAKKICAELTVQPGAYAINVQWYTHTAPVSLEYHIEKEETHPLVQSDRFLIHSGFKMTQVVEQQAWVPRTRTARGRKPRNDAKGYNRPQLNLTTKEGDWFRKDFGNIYQMDDVDRNKGLEGVRWA